MFASFARFARRDEARPELLEIVTPRTNLATVTPAENLLAAMSIADRPRPFALEMVATPTARWFLARARDGTTLSHLREQLGVAYPQAALRPLAVGDVPGMDPARLAPDEQVAACTLTLRAPQYLPLRTFDDAQVDAGRSAQADPVLGVLGALGGVPKGWRALSQLVLLPAPEKWCDGYLRLAVERPLEAERAAARASTGPSLLQVVLMAGLLGCLAVGMQAYAWYRAGDWLRLAAMILGIVGGGSALYALGRWGGLWGPKRVYDPRLVEEKIARPAYAAQVRLAVFAPLTVPRKEVEGQLRRCAAAYRQFGHAAGNGFVPHSIRVRGNGASLAASLVGLRWLPPQRTIPVLNTRELAGLWHLPQASADVPLVERTTARERLPLPVTVGRGCRVGVSRHQGREVPVHLPDALLARHLLLVGKTRKGKSSLLSRIALHLMEAPEPGEPRRGVLLVDPHSDLARSVLGAVPAARRDDVVFLEVGNEERPFGLNLLDVGMGWGKRRTVENALLIFKREFDDYWGPRMEDVFRFALLTLFEANAEMCAADPVGGPGRQHTVLEIPALFVERSFRKLVLQSVHDPVVQQWWRGYFEPMERRQQLEIVNPVQSKVQRYAGNELARNIVGQPRTTIDPRAWVRDGAVVIVDAAKSAAGEDTCALVGAALINFVGLALAGQGTLPARERRRMTLLADEIHTMPGADYESYVSELAKYGANAVLATQGLGRLDALDKKEEGRALRPTLFSNIDGLFAFQVSAQDAEYLVNELGGGLEVDDLVELADHRCYARLSTDGEKLPTFSLHLDPPPADDAGVVEELAQRSVRRHGRWRTEVEDDLRAAMARIQMASGQVSDLAREPDEAGPPSARTRRPRNDNRPPKTAKRAPDGPTLFNPNAVGPEDPPILSDPTPDDGRGPNGLSR